MCFDHVLHSLWLLQSFCLSWNIPWTLREGSGGDSHLQSSVPGFLILWIMCGSRSLYFFPTAARRRFCDNSWARHYLCLSFWAGIKLFKYSISIFYLRIVFMYTMYFAHIHPPLCPFQLFPEPPSSKYHVFLICYWKKGMQICRSLHSLVYNGPDFLYQLFNNLRTLVYFSLLFIPSIKSMIVFFKVLYVFLHWNSLDIFICVPGIS